LNSEEAKKSTRRTATFASSTKAGPRVPTARDSQSLVAVAFFCSICLTRTTSSP
jgi:hypothetical protein